MANVKDDLTQLERVEDAFGSSPSRDGSKEALPQEALDDDPVYTYKEQRAIIRRVDRRLIVTAGIIYMNSLMDRSNLPNAGIAGMNADLNMVGSRYVCIPAKSLGRFEQVANLAILMNSPSLPSSFSSPIRYFSLRQPS